MTRLLPTRGIERVVSVIVLGATLGACQTGGPVLVTSVPGQAPGPQPIDAASPPSFGWSVGVSEHVDLWLHGFAMLQRDSSLVPYFRLDYADRAAEARRAKGATTPLDQNMAELRRRLVERPELVSAQFIALYFSSWRELMRGVRMFIRDEGDERDAADAETAR